MRAHRLAAVLLALSSWSAVACRGQVSLGDREADAGAPPPVDRVVCPAAPADPVTLAEPDVSLGAIRSLAAYGGSVYALFERGATTSLVLARIASGGGVVDLAALGNGASSMAAGPDAVFVAVEREIYRVPATGGVTSVRAEGPPSSITYGNGTVFWAVAADGRVFAWDARGASAPSSLGSIPAPVSSLVFGRGVLYGAGARVSSLDALGGAPRAWTDRCGAGRVAPALYEDAVVCASSGQVLRVRGSGEVRALPDQPGAVDVFASAGRAVWRRAGGGADAIVGAPLDGVGADTVIVSEPAGIGALTTDGCAAYYTSARRVVRRAL
ncbi:MAG: hypothetical protein JST00_42225 [Deltaproteobacteria bacterium]|nr:hypothetical protein [Deltaproteobacteria bacterium]